ncbi:MAG: glycosyltransferase family 9 protein [Bacteroidales bacterium]|nr:glycosyltransferase family 9 protein [Bacteroidales bacterium]
MSSENPKALIIQTASIGDVILATGLAESLYAEDPAREIHFLVKDGMQGLFNGHPFIRKVHVWNKRKGKYSGLIRLVSETRSEHYHLVVNIQRFFSSGILTALSGSGISTGFRKNPLSFLFTYRVEHEIGNGLHETERNLKLLGPLGQFPTKAPALYPGKNDEELVRPYTEQAFITASPASLWFTKQFPEERWVEFLNQVPEPYRIYLLGGPSDQALCIRIMQQVKAREVIDLSGKLSLLQSAALMKRARMNYVNDSAPLHLASSVNAPVRAIFCSTVPSFGFGPLSGDSRVIETEEDLECRPCGLHGLSECPRGHFRCAFGININPMISELCS